MVMMMMLMMMNKNDDDAKGVQVIDITNTNTKKQKPIHATYGIYYDNSISIHFHLFTSYVTFYVHSFGRNKHRKRSFLIVSNDILYVFPLVILPFLISHTITSTKRPTPFHCSIELLLHIDIPPKIQFDPHHGRIVLYDEPANPPAK